MRPKATEYTAGTLRAQLSVNGTRLLVRPGMMDTRTMKKDPSRFWLETLDEQKAVAQ